MNLYQYNIEKIAFFTLLGFALGYWINPSAGLAFGLIILGINLLTNGR